MTRPRTRSGCEGQLAYVAGKGEFDPSALVELVRRAPRASTPSTAEQHDWHLILVVEDNERNLKLVRDVLGTRVRGHRGDAPPRTASSSRTGTSPTSC